MSRSKTRTPSKGARKTTTGGRASGGPGDANTGLAKMSVIIKEMASSLMRGPATVPSPATASATLSLAGAAWNEALGNHVLTKRLPEMLAAIDWEGESPWEELRSSDPVAMFRELVEFKRAHHPDDMRCITAMALTPEDQLLVEFVALAPRSLAPTARSKKQPIAQKVVTALTRYSRAKVVSLSLAKAARENAAALHATVATPARLAEHHPSHALYILAQNHMSVASEQLTALKETAAFTRLLARAEDEYMPSGPPHSPLTTSYFTCWAFFDCCVGAGRETLATTAIAVWKALGVDPELIRVVSLMQESKMAVYAHEGVRNGLVVLRELVTDEVREALSPSGYMGRAGELWFVRVLPPPVPGKKEHIVFTTPYVLIQPNLDGWLAYFDRTLPAGPQDVRLAAYEDHMKFGPARDFWSEFVFEAYVNFEPEVVFLKGLPDVAESRPHSEVNQARWM